MNPEKRIPCNAPKTHRTIFFLRPEKRAEKFIPEAKAVIIKKAKNKNRKMTGKDRMVELLKNYLKLVKLPVFKGIIWNPHLF